MILLVFVFDFLHSCTYDRSLVFLVDDVPALLVSNLSDAPSPVVVHGGGKPDGEGRQGDKVPDRPVGRSFIYYLYHKLLRLPGVFFVVSGLACCFHMFYSESCSVYVQ